MTEQGMTTPFEALVELEQQCRAVDAAREIEQKSPESQWSGIAYRVEDLYFLSDLTEVTEVIACPPLTRVPATKNWLKGVANIRGTVLPIIDLKEFLGRGNVSRHSKSRVLVMRAGQLSAGLLVDEVVGRLKLGESQRLPVTDNVPDDIAAYVDHYYRDEDKSLWFFRYQMLARAPEFISASVEQHLT